MNSASGNSLPAVSANPGASPSRASKAMARMLQTLAPRFWHGMTFGTWMKFLLRHRFAVSPTALHIVAGVTPISLGNSLAAVAQQAIYGRRIASTTIQPPIFIVGHWRTGTTLLHELMVQDDRFTYPTTYECIAPRQSLTTAWFVTRFFNFLLPSRRPMDNMATGWNHPQEDEFALCNLGVGSPYERMAFPNDMSSDRFLDLAGVSPEEVALWKAALERFLQTITVRSNKPIVLKSPPHTARVGLLSEMFPSARFVHIVRDPYAVFSSTMKLWPSLTDLQALQSPRYDDLREYVYGSFERMYRAFSEQKNRIRPENFCELRYEDLVRDPVAQMQSIYEHLGLGDFDRARPKIEAHMQSQKDYKPNRHQIPAERRAEISRRWGPFMRQYGYDCEPPAAPPVLDASPKR
ncbi:MAG TPA: sulfotransferase [Pirellulales bacterium]|nr:sulfotransferase [Pirellulales bacterium]